MILVYIFLGIFVSLFAVKLIFKRYQNRWKLYMIFGKKGSGKSTFLAKTAIRYIKYGYNVYTNMPDLMISGVRFIDIDQLGKFVPVANSVLLCEARKTITL